MWRTPDGNDVGCQGQRRMPRDMRRCTHLGPDERDGIVETHARHEGVSSIAREMGRDKSMVGRELVRNSRRGCCGACGAQGRAEERRAAQAPQEARRPRPGRDGPLLHPRRPLVPGADRGRWAHRASLVGCHSITIFATSSAPSAECHAHSRALAGRAMFSMTCRDCRWTRRSVAPPTASGRARTRG